jgi:hypothetical protein
VYAALDSPYPGTGDDRRAANSTAIALHSYREPDKQSSGKTTDGRNRSGQSVPSPTDGINIPLGSSAAAVRRRTGFSGFESDDNARRNDGGTMKTNRHHEDREQRENEPTTELLADGGSTVRADAGTDDLPRESIREHVTEHPDATLSGILAAAEMHPNPLGRREQAALVADLARGRLGVDPQPAPRPELGETTAVCANDGCTETEELIPHRSTAERAETWVCRDCLVEAMDPSVDELGAEYGNGGSA